MKQEQIKNNIFIRKNISRHYELHYCVSSLRYGIIIMTSRQSCLAHEMKTFKKLTQGNKPESHVSYGNYARCEYNKKLRFVMLLHFSERN